MQENQTDGVGRWEKYTLIGLSHSKMAFTTWTHAIASSVFVVGVPAAFFGPYQSLLGPALIIAACVAVLAAVIAIFVLYPISGRVFLEEIEAFYGPKTRAGVWQWHSTTDEGKGLLDVSQIARDVGEFEHIAQLLADARSLDKDEKID